jgi:hypothetical protein
VILHIGAHRTGTTTLQTYARAHSDDMASAGLGYWGPARLRKGALYGVAPRAILRDPAKAFQRSQGRIQMWLDRSAQRGVETLLVSEENILGHMRNNVAAETLYGTAGDRLARHMIAFDGRISKIIMSTRSLDSYWTSCMSFCIPRGMRVPNAKKMRRLAEQARNWRDVIADVASAVPGIPIEVRTFERSASRPDLVLNDLADGLQLPRARGIWRNPRPGVQDLLKTPLVHKEREFLVDTTHLDMWQPFSNTERANLRERYADDMFWLQSGADGLATLATLANEPINQKTGFNPHSENLTRGLEDDNQQQMAGPG